jgi:hypothetical protein
VAAKPIIKSAGELRYFANAVVHTHTREHPISVDDFEDAGFPEFNKGQQASTSPAYLAETEYIENRRLLQKAANGLP